jgi:Asp-tRNA(Asn)/Glu-tRNA(Gln) amidotransferase B subunit
VELLGLAQVCDDEQLVEWCRAALAGKPRRVADVQDGELKALGALMGR